MQGQAIPSKPCLTADMSNKNAVASSPEVVGHFVTHRGGTCTYITEHGEVLGTVLSAHAMMSHCRVSNLPSVGKFHSLLRLVVPHEKVIIAILVIGVVLAF